MTKRLKSQRFAIYYTNGVLAHDWSIMAKDAEAAVAKWQDKHDLRDFPDRTVMAVPWEASKTDDSVWPALRECDSSSYGDYMDASFEDAAADLEDGEDPDDAIPYRIAAAIKLCDCGRGDDELVELITKFEAAWLLFIERGYECDVEAFRALEKEVEKAFLERYRKQGARS